jgi:hypothetical protein
MPIPSPVVERDVLGKSEHSSTRHHVTTGGHGRHRLVQMLAMWLSIYPALTLALWLFERVGFLQLALPLRTLILTVVLVPAMVFVLMPVVTNALHCATRVESSAKS